jgi:hypothetical protein
MFVSTRETFSNKDPAWVGYMKFRGSHNYVQVRTIDGMLNPHVNHSRDVEVSPQTLASSVEALSTPKDSEYILLAINLDQDPDFVPIGWNLLGYDLTDETWTSSLLNCGPWKGQLQPFADRQNQFGLLSRSDAEAAQDLLPLEWGENEPHAQVVVWALFEREQG